MRDVIVVGGGLAGLAAAAALGGAGYRVDLYETRGFLGGRATSYPVASADEVAETIDNCQHILLRCCVNLIDFYERLQVADRIHFQRDFVFLEPGGRASTLRAGMLPKPLHFTGSFLKLKFLRFGDKMAIARGLLALRREHATRQDLDRISMLDWLAEKRQTKAAIECFWRQVLVSAINEDLDLMAAAHGFQVFWLGFLARADSYQMGVPAVPLGDLYGSDAWQRFPNVGLHTRSGVERLIMSNGRAAGVSVGGEIRKADYYVLAVPFERIAALASALKLNLEGFTHSPITGIHLWFDRPITDLPNATLLGRTIQWLFNKSEGRYVQLVVSASRKLVDMSRADVIALALRELGDFFPAAREAKLEKAHVVKEVRATFSARPGLEALRPAARTSLDGVFLAGDWTRSGWPATMEGAVRSGYLAAEAVTEAAGNPRKIVLPDVG
jgi:squalene-associated FAD-dependent desaturase